MTEEIIKKHLVAKGTVTVMPETNKKVKRDVNLIFSRGLNGFTWLKWNIIPEYKQILIKIKNKCLLNTQKHIYTYYQEHHKLFEITLELLL